MIASAVEVRAYDRRDMRSRWGHWEAFVARRAPIPLSYHPAWLEVLAVGLGHAPHCLEAADGGEVRGLLPLAFVRSILFGKALVGLPYLNYGGVMADDEDVARLLIDRAVGLAGRLGARRLEVRHERAVEHPDLRRHPGRKVNVTRSLPATAGELWDGLGSGVRNQVRKGRKGGLAVAWGGEELLPEFHAVFSRNMRDLGTPSYGPGLFRAIVRQFPDRAEFCVVRAGDTPAAAALLVHGWGVTEVPSASSIRRFNPSCANMLMYWNLLERAVGRGQSSFDFGRSTAGGPVLKFKEQWGGRPTPAEWRVYAPSGEVGGARPDDPRYGRMIRLWKRLPLAVARHLGPLIVRGIP